MRNFNYDLNENEQKDLEFILEGLNVPEDIYSNIEMNLILMREFNSEERTRAVASLRNRLVEFFGNDTSKEVVAVETPAENSNVETEVVVETLAETSAVETEVTNMAENDSRPIIGTIGSFSDKECIDLAKKVIGNFGMLDLRDHCGPDISAKKLGSLLMRIKESGTILPYMTAIYTANGIRLYASDVAGSMIPGGLIIDIKNIDDVSIEGNISFSTAA